MMDKEDQEPLIALSEEEEEKEIHTAVKSLMEELDTAYVFSQRAGVCQDKRLKEILTQHGHDEEKHAAILLEWLRKKENRANVDSSPIPTN